MQRQRGFTLLEIMVVIVILGILASLVVPNLMGNKEKADRQKVVSDLVALEGALDMYKLDNSRYPNTEQGLQALVTAPAVEPHARNYPEGGYIRRLPQDPWGNEYQLLSPGQHGAIDVFSVGPDGMPDSASMVLLAFPSARTQEATQILARFQAQLDFVRERGQQTGQLFGIVIHPDRWQFMRLQPADEGAPAAADDRWGNAQWLPLQAGRATTAETLPRARLTLRFPNGQAWTPGEQPDVLIFPGGEVTPFQLRIDAATGINIDAQGDSQPLAAREQP